MLIYLIILFGFSYYLFGVYDFANFFNENIFFYFEVIFVFLVIFLLMLSGIYVVNLLERLNSTSELIAEFDKLYVRWTFYLVFVLMILFLNFMKMNDFDWWLFYLYYIVPILLIVIIIFELFWRFKARNILP